jgi:DNA processing protein
LRRVPHLIRAPKEPTTSCATGATLGARVEDALNALEPLRGRASAGRMEEPHTNDELWLDEPADAGEPTPAAREDSGETAVGARVVALLGPVPVSIDELARVANADVRLVRAALIELELAGRIERGGGDRVALLTARDRD